MQEILVGNIYVKVQRRRVKNLNLYVRYPSGEVLMTIPYGVKLEEAEQFLKRKESWIQNARSRIEKRKQEEESAVTEEQVKQMLGSLEGLLERWQIIMGVKATSITIREMKTRWGSCTVTSGRIRLNRRLAGKPKQCLEYVLVHELCHLLEPSHNARFYSLMDGFLPDWRERKKCLENRGGGE